MVMLSEGAVRRQAAEPQRAVRAGASGFVRKDVPVDDLAHAIRSVANDDAVVSPRITRRLLDAYAAHLPNPPTGTTEHAQPALDQLTPHEQDVLRAVAAGLSNAAHDIGLVR
jgi:DNA-binding NarL/FixJ family response regulator